MKHTHRTLSAAIFVVALLVLAGQTLQAQTCDSTGVRQGGRHLGFVDANGDGINDLAPDHDGDGIPNGKDPDYQRTGNGRGHGFVDADGDGINDYAQDADGDGIPNGKDPDYVRPLDGSGRKVMSGFGRGGGMQGFGRSAGTGVCRLDGSAVTRRGMGGRRGR